VEASEHADVTAIVPCYEQGRFLEESVGSLLAQHGGPPHIVVVDDGSTDPQTLAAFEALPPQVELVRQANAGLAAARNAGIARATTPLILPLDADDRLLPEALWALRPALDDPRLGFSYGRIRFFGDWRGELTMPPYDPFKLLYRHTIGATALVRSELYEQTGGYDTAFAGYEDWELWLHALACGWQGRRVDTVTLEYRRHAGTIYATTARPAYRRWYRALRAKHAGLYTRASRRRLAAQSDLGPLGRGVYRWFWGPRPVPARVELAFYRRLWARKPDGAPPPPGAGSSHR
jgi:glycosyltransferase involved in cell wall biosynthesis